MQRTKPIAVLALLVGALGALGAWTQDWFAFTVTEGASISVVSVSGPSAAPLVSSTAMGLLAGIAVLLIGQHVMRLAVAVIMIVISALGITSIIGTLNDPISASKAELSRVTGVADVDALAQQVNAIAASPWPAVCLAALAVAVLGAIIALGFSVNWKSSRSRYERPEPNRPNSGTPNSGEPNSAGPKSSTANARQTPAEVHDGDSWDTLSKGADPTR